MRRDAEGGIGTMLGYAIQHGVIVFGLGALWSYAVGAEGVLSLVIVAAIASLVGGFMGLATLGSMSAGSGSCLMFGPIYGIVAVIGVVVAVI